MSEALVNLASVLRGLVPAAQAPSISGNSDTWNSVEVAARELANSLRSRGEIGALLRLTGCASTHTLRVPRQP